MGRGSGMLAAVAVALAIGAFACGDSQAANGDRPIDTATRTPTATPTSTATTPPLPTSTRRPTPRPTATAIPTPSPAPLAAAGGGTTNAAVGAVTGRPLPPPGVAIASLSLPRFGIVAGMESIGLLPDNELATPANPYAVGWYSIYDFPGGPGNAVFSGHVDYYPNILGPFYHLADLAAGDEVNVSLTDGSVLRYRVISNTRYSVYTIPMGDIIWPASRPPDEEWITLITCGGEFRATSASGAGEYLHRDVVVARRVNW